MTNQKVVVVVGNDILKVAGHDVTPALTGNRQFDNIVDISWGMSILVLDETFSEAAEFIRKLYKNQPLTEFVSPRQSYVGRFNRSIVEVDNLQELSIAVNKVRRASTPRIFVHVYLPELLVKHGAEQVLRLIDFWRAEIKQTGHLEFFLLPKKTFSDFEKKLIAIVDGAIELTTEKSASKFQNFFVPMRIAREGFHLRPIPYLIKNDELIVVEPVVGVEAAVKNLAHKLLADDRLKVVYTGASSPLLPLNDLLLLKEINGLTMGMLKRVYPDKLDDLALKIAAFVDRGFVKMFRHDDDEERLIGQGDYRRKVLQKLRTLACVETKDMLDTISSYVSVNFPKAWESESLTLFLTELYARLLAAAMSVENGKRNFEKTMEKFLIEVTEMKPRIRKESFDTYVVEFSSCKLCVGIKAAEPVCGCLANLIAASSTVFIGRGMMCVEVECCATHGRKCVFKLQSVNQARTEILG